MKSQTLMPALCLALALTLAACGGGADSSGSTEPISPEPTEAESAEPAATEPASSGRISLAESEMPVNTPEHEAYVEQ